MASQNSLFPLLLLALAVLSTQALSPVGSCLANCATCEPNNLAVCKGAQSCEWGHYDPIGNGTCIALPTLQAVSSELDGEPINTFPGWGKEAKYSTCQYYFQGKRKIVDVLGIFDGVTTVSKEFSVTPGQQVYFLSFNLLRDEWMPFSDFLMLEILNDEDTLQSIEISYESRMKVESQPSTLTCTGKRFMSEKYNIRITGVTGTKMSIIFSSFLDSSHWALTNIKIMQGCQFFSAFDEKAQTCSKCESDSYLAKSSRGGFWCERCPEFCATCRSQNQCITCVAGAKLESGSCSFPSDFKIQRMGILQGKTTCGTNTFLLGYLGKSVITPSLTNDKNQLYNEIQIGFSIFYNPADWNSKTLEQIKVKINKGYILIIGYQNLTNTATDYCKEFTGERLAMVSLLSKPFVQVSSVLNFEFELFGKNNISFGIDNVFIKSLANNNEQSIQHQIQNLTQKVANPSHDQPLSLTSAQKQRSTLNPNVTSADSTPTMIIHEPTFEEEQHLTVERPLSGSFDGQYTLDYLPTVCHEASGMQIIVSNVNQIKGQLLVNIDKLNQNNYQIASSYIDESTLHICISIRESFIDGVITVYDAPTESTSRLLQTSGSTILAQGTVHRFDSLSSSQLASISRFSVVFSVFAWAGVIMIICAVMIGFGVTMQELIFTLQLLFLHVYIASQDLPLSFREVIAGLRVVQNLNFFIPSQARSIEHQWLGNVIQGGPGRLSLYNTDINFSREFYPILIINIIYFLWFCLVFAARKWVLRSQEKSMIARVADNIVERIINFADQAWRYQFLATVWFCILQFHNFSYPVGSDRSQAMNAIFCVSCFLATLAWPVLIGYYCRKQFYQTEYEQFVYQFEDLFYLRIPRFFLPSPHHRVGYRALTIAKSLLIALLIGCTGNYPAILLPLIIIQGAELAYINKNEIILDKKYRLLKVIENCLFIVLEVFILVMLTMEGTVTSNTFIGFGWALSAIGFIIMFNSAFRAGYLVVRKYSDLMGVEFEEADPDQNKLKTERVV